MIAAVLLAAGRSTRFEGGHKLLAEHRGEPVVVHAARALTEAGLAPLVVLGARADEVRAAIGRALPDAPVSFVRNERHAEGMGRSLAKGVASLPRDAAAVLIALGDMPLVTGREIALVRAAHDVDDPHAVTRAVAAGEGHAAGRPGHPTVLGHGWFAALCELNGDRGATSILKDVPFRAVPVDPATQADVDTRDALASLGPDRGRA